MKLKELESFLSQCEHFKTPKIALEQYATSAHIAARMIYAAQDNMKGKFQIKRKIHKSVYVNGFINYFHTFSHDARELLLLTKISARTKFLSTRFCSM